jgi:tetratricopeptide (TPR) repeat protein
MSLPFEPSSFEPFRSESLGEQAESEWLRLRRQWELAEGFWLGFLFVDSYLVATQFRERLSQLLRSQVGQTLLLTAREPDDLRPSQRSPSLVDQLLAEPARGAQVIWLEGLPGREDTVQPVSAWENAWGELLLRINERRERLRRELSGGLLIVASPGVRDAVRDAAPDLWSIRSIVLSPRLPHVVDVAAGNRLELDPSADVDGVISRPAAGEDSVTASDSTDPVELLREARGLLSQDRPRSALRRAAQAIDRLTETELVDPVRVAEAFQLQAEAELADNDPASALQHSRYALSLLDADLREEHFDWLRTAAESAERCGAFDDALQLRETAVELARRLLTRTEDSKTLVRELQQSLNWLGNFHFQRGDRESALAEYREQLEISERIVTHFGETPESLRDLSVSLEKVGNVEVAEGRREAALESFRRGLEIRERIVAHFGETPQSLRDLSVSLNKVGDVEVAEGRREAALESFRRGLEIRERIVEHFGETPESLWDVVVSRFKMAQAEPEQASEHLAVARNVMQILIDRNWTTADQQPWLEMINTALAELNGDTE